MEGREPPLEPRGGGSGWLTAFCVVYVIAFATMWAWLMWAMLTE